MPDGIHHMDVVLDGRISQSVLSSLAMAVLPKPTLSPVPRVLSGTDQARFSPQLSYFAFFLSQIAALLHLVRSPGAPIGAFPKLHEKRTLWQF
jgi:hypothetical protein